MYAFAVIALLALASVKVVDFVCDNLTVIDRFRSLLTFVVTVELWCGWTSPSLRSGG